MSLYNVVIMCVLGVAISAVLQEQRNASFVLISVFIIFCTTLTLCLVFVPKVNAFTGRTICATECIIVGEMKFHYGNGQ